MRIVKLGGSLLTTTALPACLSQLETLAGNSVIVPGGGVFAEQVRLMQTKFSFDDLAAHRMAILAMQQMAYLIKGLKSQYHQLCTVANPAWTGVAIWFPQIAELDSAGIPANWDISSDSLAAWLALQLTADELILVKSAPINPDHTLAELQQAGIIDAAFLEYAELLNCPVTIINKDRFIVSS